MSAKHDPVDRLDPRNWIGPRELAAILGFKSHQTIYNKISAGHDLPPLHYLNSGKSLRFFRPEVEAWLAKTPPRLTAAAQLKLTTARPTDAPRPWLPPVQAGA
jgi:predicted DNA-binding transcriptional regulator AlpA